MAGLWEFVKRGDPPVMGITKMSHGVTLTDSKNRRVKLPGDVTAQRIPASMPGHLPDAPTAPPSAASPP